MSTENKISFDDTNFKIRSRSILGAPEVPSIIRALVKKGIVKNERQAITIILSIVIILIVASVFLIRESVSVQPAIIDPSLISNK